MTMRRPPFETSEFPASGGSLSLLTVPFVFTQDDLLTSGDFIKMARERGYRLSLDKLQELHERRLLVPLFRVSDTPVEGRRIENIQFGGNYNVRLWVLEAAADGRVRDSAEEGFSSAWPYSRPDGERHNPGWWNGFAFSSWQLLDLDYALNTYAFIHDGWRREGDPVRATKNRHLTQALAALSPRYLPSVIGRLSLPPGIKQEALWKFRSESDLVELLELAGFAPSDLKQEAEGLLMEASTHDPLEDWLPLIRHAGFKAWSKLKGAALQSMWRRISAEVLLRAYEDLAVAGHLDPLPDISRVVTHMALHDRITPRHDDAKSLESALGDFGLSPYPRVLVLVEGETELKLLPRLLKEFDIGETQQVRVQLCKGSHVNHLLLARYSITPRIGKRQSDFWFLEATPTVLVVAVDAENKWSTAEKQLAERRKLQEVIREEVQWQGADIMQEDLDYLVRVCIWGLDKFEIANFTNDELITAVREIAQRRSASALPGTWEQEFRVYLEEAREQHSDIKIALGKMRLGKPKLELTELLWPVLLAKCERELAADSIETPILKLTLEIRQLVASLSSGSYALRVPEGFSG